MPDPREAVYDVLKAKWERRRDELRRERERAVWEQYQRDNRRAAAVYRNQAGAST